MKSIDDGSLQRDPSLQYELIDDLVEEFLKRRREGRAVSIDEFADEHPALSREIRELFPTLMQMENLGKSQDSGILSRSQNGNSGCDSNGGYEPAGTKIGSYTLVSLLGEGGFGIVYKVEQHEPIRRFLAMKIIRQEMNSREVSARFNSERQTLAILDHPNIAKIIDGGTSESGRPYFVMDLVEGLPITKHCETHSLSIRERVELFIGLCDGIQHAHVRGIIHRDLKPSNVLVSNSESGSVCKVIDFGIAKAFSHTVDDCEPLTKFTQIVGTPLYMSPEQSRFGASNLDTRSDIFSLGVILYELLTLRTPIARERLATLSPTELQFVISEETPKPPRSLCKDVSIDLETIVLKAIAKEKRDRYQSAGEMAEDLRLYLADLPIRSRRSSAVERVWRWARRKPAMAGAFSGMILLGIGFVATTIASNYRIRHETAAKSKALDEKSAALAEKNQAMIRLESSLDEQKRLSRLAFQRYYATQINLAGQAWLAGEPTRAADLLRTVLPSEEQPDIRGFEWHFLQNKIHDGLLRRIEIPGEEIIDLTFSPDGKQILIVGGTPHSGFADLFDVETGELIARLHEETDFVNGCAYAPNGDFFGIATGNGAFRVFEAASQKVVYSEHLNVLPKSMEWSPRNDIIVVGCDNGELRLWSVDGFVSRPPVKAHRGPILRMRFSRDGKSLFTNAEWGGEGMISREWAVEFDSLREINRFPEISVFSESTDGKRLAANTSGVFFLLKRNDGKKLLEKHLSSGALAAAHFSSDGQSVFVGSRRERMVRQLDPKNLNVLRNLPHRRAVQALAWDSKNDRLAAGDAAGETSIWRPSDLDDGIVVQQSGFKQVHWIDKHSTFVLLGKESPKSATEGENGRLTLSESTISIEDKEEDRRTEFLTLSDDGETVAKLKRDSDVHYVEISKSTLPDAVQTVRLDGPIFEKCFELSPDGRYLAVTAYSLPLRVYDLASEKPKEIFSLAYNAFDCEFSPDGNRLIVTGQYGIVEQIDLVSKKLLPRLSDFVSLWAWGREIAMSPSGRYLAVGDDTGVVRVWRTDDCQLIATLSGQAGDVKSLAFFPDDERLVVGGPNNMRLWNFRLEQELLLLPTFDRLPISIAIDPSGHRIVAVMWSGAVQTWSSTSQSGSRTSTPP